VSLKVDYFLLRKDKFEEFCQKKNLVPGRSPTIEEMEEGGKGTGQIRLVTQSEMNSPEFRKRMADNKKLWAYFDQFLDAPFKFNWGGIVISELVYCLRSMDVVDLTEHSLIPEGGGFDWLVIDEKHFEICTLTPCARTWKSNSVKCLGRKMPKNSSLRTSRNWTKIFPKGERRCWMLSNGFVSILSKSMKLRCSC
jgi:hypothetical protein